MEMPSGQWSLDLGMEDPALVGPCISELAVPTIEQLKELMGYQSNIADEANTSLMGYQSNIADEANTSLTGYPSNVKLPAKISHLGVRQSRGYLGSERPAKQSKANNSQGSSFPGYSSEISTSPPIYCPNSQQNLQHSQIENYFASFFKVKGDETYENVAPTTPGIQSEILANGEHDHSRISDISRSDMDAAFSISSGRLLRSSHLPSDMRISKVRHSNEVANKASGNSQDHIMAERKRREKLSQRFIALSAIVPGLKKMDKASVLSDAIKYVKQLQDTIKALEDQAPNKIVESVVRVKKEELCTDDQDGSNQDSSEIRNSSSSGECVTGVLSPHEIEIRAVNRKVLIHVHCENRDNLLYKFLSELVKLQLTVVNASILTFPETTLELTFNAQMEEGCDLTPKDIAKALQALFE